MAKPNLKVVVPEPRAEPLSAQLGRPLPPRKRPYKEVRSREYLTEGEVERLLKAAASNRHAHRDQTMVLLGYRRGLRGAELISLHWDAIDFVRGELHVARVKNGSPAVHPLLGRELRALRKLKREQTPASPFVFTSERSAPFAARGWRQMIERLGKAAGFDFPVHAHMLRHACGYKLANDGHATRTVQQYLGHRNIQHTVRYTELSPAQFKNLWRD
jgi:type 1 fimbriae regulatory protein FimB/type 1 fimbriae regulatory protein FimE